MAESKKRGGSAKSKTGNTKKSGSTKKAAPKASSGAKAQPQKDPVNQFWSVILFAAGILIFLFTVIEGSSGWRVIHNLFRGLFGLSVFLVPVILIYTALLISMERSQQTVAGRAMWGIGLTLLSSSVVQIMFAGEAKGDSFIEKCRYLYEAGSNLEGGGLLSALIAWPLLKFFGSIGAKIIICVLLFIFIMLLSNLTLFQFFGLFYKPFVKMYHSLQKIREENHILDSYEEWEYDEEQEAISIANSNIPEQDVVPDDDFDFDIPVNDSTDLAPPDFKAPEWSGQSGPAIDIPIDGVIPEPSVQKAAETAETDMKEKQPESTETKKPENELDALVEKAVVGGDRENLPETFAEKAARAEENAPEKADIKPAAAKKYVLPPINLLSKSVTKANDPAAAAELKEKADTLISTLKSFGVIARIVAIQRGPRVTRYEIQPAAGVKVSKITNLSDDIALNMAAAGVRIEAPIPGKAAIGIEIPNTNQDIVSIREIIESKEFQTSKSKLAFAVGKDIAGNIIIGDVAKMPHMIIAGTTGSGKSVCTNSIIMSILYHANPEEVKLILIDPKMVEFTTYNGIPHLLIPVVTDPRQAAGALNWGVQEMLRRYKLFADNNVRDLGGYNEMAAAKNIEKLPQIVIAIDEFSDLMMAASKEVEDAVCRLAQMARAAGMHLIIATQRPTTDVITGLIKANIPSRIALSVQSQVDSRTILDTQGAEKLLGYGDMLYYPNGMQKPLRVQGCLCSTKEVEAIVGFIKKESESEYNADIIEAVEQSMPAEKGERSSDTAESMGDGDDILIEKAIDIVVEMGQASTSSLQRKLKLGYARAARIIDELENMGVVGPYEGAKPRKVLMSKQQWSERRMRKSIQD
ncbi:DNA translocase FtsK 4TM domain-containing protein [Porcipelethomonas sp.]|uniref:FtsK/SpoIIIE family DNA translocase n=1 Tax=Porcipelethomonas sp. TaxID=2981675 RepID=UPI003EF65098